MVLSSSGPAPVTLSVDRGLVIVIALRRMRRLEGRRVAFGAPLRVVIPEHQIVPVPIPDIGMLFYCAAYPASTIFAPSDAGYDLHGSLPSAPRGPPPAPPPGGPPGGGGCGGGPTPRAGGTVRGR